MWHTCEKAIIKQDRSKFPATYLFQKLLNSYNAMKYMFVKSYSKLYLPTYPVIIQIVVDIPQNKMKIEYFRLVTVFLQVAVPHNLLKKN